MKVVVGAGGRFHAFRLAHQLERHKCLEHFFTAGSLNQSVDAAIVPKTTVCHSVAFADRAWDVLRLSRFVHPSHWFVVKDNFFDWWWRRYLKDFASLDIVVGWAHYVGNSLSVIRERGARLVIESGSRHILDQQQILTELYQSVGKTIKPIDERNIAKVLKEYDAADAIAVPSTHVAESFFKYGVDRRKVFTVPYGVDYDDFYTKRLAPPKKFQVLFAGLVSIRKGIHILLDAWKKLDLPKDKAELVIAGYLLDAHDQLRNLPAGVRYVGPCSKDSLRSLYAQSSLFVLPSFEEGLAMVQAEALAAGVPIIATERTGALDIMVDGEHGFVIDAGDVDSLAERLAWAFENKERLFAMGIAGQQMIKHATWDRYGDHVVLQYKRICA